MIPQARPCISEEEIDSVIAVLRSGNIASGEKVSEFEDRFSGYVETKKAVACVNGTAALHTALLSCGISKGDEVIVPSFSFIATASAVSMTGATPVFADVEPFTYGIDIEDVRRKTTKDTKAVIAAHLYGLPCWCTEELVDYCEDVGIYCIEDAAQAIGSNIRGNMCGSFGDVSCFSFYATKNITTGEGGMITTDNLDIEDAARMIINHGQHRKYVHERLGYNYRMTDIMAAIGIGQLGVVDNINRCRRRIAQEYGRGIEVDGTFAVPEESALNNMGFYHVYHQYVMRLFDDFPVSQHDFVRSMRSAGVGVSIHYPIPIHKQPLYNRGNCCLPVSEKLSTSVVSLPIYPSMTMNDVDFVIDRVNEVIR